LLILHLLDLLALALDLLLLLLDLTLGLGLLGFLILHLVTYGKTAKATHRAANRRACGRMANGGADDRSSTRAQYRAYPGAFLTSRKRLPAASCHE
jgi:hypothetical protein